MSEKGGRMDCIACKGIYADKDALECYLYR